MRKRLLFYLPSLLLLVTAVLLPAMGRNFVGRMNGREFALILAFWWTIFTAGIHLVSWIVRGSRHPVEQRGFEILPKTPDKSARK